MIKAIVMYNSETNDFTRWGGRDGNILLFSSRNTSLPVFRLFLDTWVMEAASASYLAYFGLWEYNEVSYEANGNVMISSDEAVMKNLDFTAIVWDNRRDSYDDFMKIWDEFMKEESDHD